MVRFAEQMLTFLRGAITQHTNINTNDSPFGACAFHIHREGDTCHVTGQQVTEFDVLHHFDDEMSDLDETGSVGESSDQGMEDSAEANPLLRIHGTGDMETSEGNISQTSEYEEDSEGSEDTDDFDDEEENGNINPRLGKPKNLDIAAKATPVPRGSPESDDSEDTEDSEGSEDTEDSGDDEEYEEVSPAISRLEAPGNHKFAAKEISVLRDSQGDTPGRRETRILPPPRMFSKSLNVVQAKPSDGAGVDNTVFNDSGMASSNSDSDLKDSEDFNDEIGHVSQGDYCLEQGGQVQADTLNEAPLASDKGQPSVLDGSEEPTTHEGASFPDFGARISHPGFDYNGDINKGNSSTLRRIDMGDNDKMALENQRFRNHYPAAPTYVDAPPPPWAAAPPGHAWMLTRPQWVLAPVGLRNDVVASKYNQTQTADHFQPRRCPFTRAAGQNWACQIRTRRRSSQRHAQRGS